MSTVVNTLETLSRNMGVNLGRLQRGMAEQFLHDPQICPTLEHVGRRAVPQGVGTQIAVAGALGGPFDDAADLALVDASAPGTEEQCSGSR